MKTLTQSELKSKYKYFPKSGIFRHIRVNGLGCIAGKNNQGYLELSIGGTWYKAHRLAWLYVYGEMPKLEIDHKNMLKDDNRINNLRDISRHKNA